jgi:N-methylhydantoinase A/acetone carboxylase beta subunit
MTNPVSVVGIDAGGTMTDALLVDDAGRFVVGKAQSSPQDEASAILVSMVNGVRYWDGELREMLPTVEHFVYSGTAVLNRLLERRGLRLGAIVTAGHEDYFRLERGKQTYVGYSYDDQLHAVSHCHNEPLIPRERMCGVRERINCAGEVEIPLYEHEVLGALERLLVDTQPPVEGIVVSLLYAYKSQVHERRVEALARDFMREHGITLPVYLSSELYPLRGDLMRLNTLAIDAYCAAPARAMLKQVNDRVREHGYRREIRIMTSYGGAGSVDSPTMAHTVMSGPIGGVIGSQFLARHYGTDNLVCSDIGGTSFDVAIVTRGNVEMSTENAIARSLVNIPMIGIESIGAGTGSYISIDKTFGRPIVSERSAGYRIGMCWPEGGVEQPTINDCNVILGRLNPDYFLGGDLDLDVERAVAGIEEQLTRPLGLTDPYATAAGVLEIIEMRMKDHLRSVVMAKGYTPDLYTCVCYGGGGPTHVINYTNGLDFKDVLVPSWAAAFSAFGCACTQPSLRRDITLDQIVPPIKDLDVETRTRIGKLLNGTFERLENANRREILADGWKEGDISFTRKIAVHYRGQLKPLEISCPVDRIEQPGDLDRIIDTFEEHYSRVYSLAARFPRAGYVIASVALVAEMPAVSPTIPELPLEDEAPPRDAKKDTRNVYWGNGWVEADVYEMDRLRAGNRITGPAVVESQTTTLVVPETHVAELDAHMVFHLAKRSR